MVASGVNELMLSEETEERKSVIETSAYIFLGYATKLKSRGRKYQVCYPFVQEEEDPRRHCQVEVWRCLNSL